MSRYLLGLLMGGALVSGAGLTFALVLIFRAAHERHAAQRQPVETIRCIACQRTVQWPATQPWPRACARCGLPAAYTATSAVQSIYEAGIERQAERLRAELDDPAAVDAWLTGGPR